MQDIHQSGEAYGVDNAVCVSIEVVDDLENAGAAESSQRFGKRRLDPTLRIPKPAADSASDLLGECAQVILAAADPAHRLR